MGKHFIKDAWMGNGMARKCHQALGKWDQTNMTTIKVWLDGWKAQK